MGLAIGPDDKIWYVDAAENELIRIDLTLPFSLSEPAGRAETS